MKLARGLAPVLVVLLLASAAPPDSTQAPPKKSVPAGWGPPAAPASPHGTKSVPASPHGTKPGAANPHGAKAGAAAMPAPPLKPGVAPPPPAADAKEPADGQPLKPTKFTLGVRHRVIQETAIIARLGVAVLLVTNLFILPLLLARVPAGSVRGETRSMVPARLWPALLSLTRRGPAAAAIAVAAILFLLAIPSSRQVRIGDLQAGVPELRPESRYNRDVEEVIGRFSIGVDVITVICETEPEGCVDHAAMDAVDRLAWTLENVEGVHSTLSLPGVVKVLHAGWNEGSLKWRALPRDPTVLAQSVSRVETATGLLNAECTAMPVMVFTEDHRAETIDRVLAAVRGFDPEGVPGMRIRLAGGNVGVMAATNEAVRAAQYPMLLFIYGVVVLFCLLVFRSLGATACIVLPLALTSVLGYTLMALTGIGLKVFTLPVVALGTGIGVDYGIYVFANFRQAVRGRGLPYPEAMAAALRTTGNAVVFTGLTLAVGVSTWIFSALRFQADMGLLLTFMFLVNMVGAVVLLPGLATWVVGRRWLWPMPARAGGDER